MHLVVVRSLRINVKGELAAISLTFVMGHDRPSAETPVSISTMTPLTADRAITVVHLALFVIKDSAVAPTVSTHAATTAARKVRSAAITSAALLE